MHQKTKDTCVAYMERIIENIKNDKYQRINMKEDRPLKINSEGQPVRDLPKPCTLTLYFEKVEV